MPWSWADMFRDVLLNEQSSRVKLYKGMEKLNSLCSRSSEGLSAIACSDNPWSKCSMFGSPKGSSNELEKRLSVGCPMLFEGPYVESSTLDNRQNEFPMAPQRSSPTNLMYVSVSKLDMWSCMSSPEFD